MNIDSQTFGLNLSFTDLALFKITFKVWHYLMYHSFFKHGGGSIMVCFSVSGRVKKLHKKL